MPILAVGDSITAGYYDGGTKFHPYTIKLSQLLNKIKITNLSQSGISTKDLRDKVVMFCKHKPKKIFESAIVLAGLNDLGTYMQQKIPFSKLIDEIEGICKLLLKRKVKIVYLMTLPICPLDAKLGWYNLIKNQVNLKIRTLATERIKIIDIGNQLSYGNMGPNEKLSLWCDDIHFSKLGYDRLAEVIFENMNMITTPSNVVETTQVLKSTKPDKSKIVSVVSEIKHNQNNQDDVD
jgi:lysophospholipase L1-like esterase